MTASTPGSRSMLLGALIGAVTGIVAHLLWNGTKGLAIAVDYVSVPLGQAFLRLLFMLVMPIVFAALVMGVCELELGSLARIAIKTMVYTLVVSFIAVVIGLTAVNVVQPGRIGSYDVGQGAQASPQQQTVEKSPIELILAIIPDNPIKAVAQGDMLAWLTFSLIFGIGLSLTRSAGATSLKTTIQGLYDVLMRLINMVLKLGPVGVGALMFTTTARLGPGILGSVGAYAATVIVALAIHMFGIYPLLLWVLARKNPITFFKQAKDASITAFSTASSTATLPTALRVAEDELALPRDVSRFVLTAGATMNQNGSALFEGVTVLFLAQVYGIDMSIPKQLMVLLICVLAGVGTAGVPAGTLPVIAMMMRMLEIPAEGLGLILGVDRLLDMCRTSLNVTGDLVAAVIVAKGEEKPPPTTAPTPSRM
ncbi:MAG: dicarboxylate/amino acid:cation symporter [Myxococcota bacterium]|nr:dicarboxylate/amino acid:cation symporter [Myxococcota bacterium]